MSRRRRIALKLIWMGILVGGFVLFSQVRHDFIYQAF